jgi:hypothetical protein
VNVIEIDGRRLLALKMLAMGVKYRLGSKPKFGAVPLRDFKTSDCSGFVRWILFGASDGRVKMEPGSWHQHRGRIRGGRQGARWSAENSVHQRPPR